jgi:glycosyltransferase involved in cell wall biosynthesis
MHLVDLAAQNRIQGFARLLKFIRSDEPERVLVFNHQIAIALVIVRAALNLNLRVIARNITMVGEARKYKKRSLYRLVVSFAMRQTYRHVDTIIAQSKGMRDELVENYKISPQMITVIPNPINPRIEAAGQRLERDLSLKPGYLLCVGRLVDTKAFHYVVDAFAEIVQTYPGLRLKFVGEGPSELQLKQRAKDRGVSDLVEFCGFQRDTVPYYMGARATLLTSLFEGFPNVLVESIALGTPIVAFDCPAGPREIVIDGRNGFLVRHRDEQHLLECLASALSRRWDYRDIRATAQRFRSGSVIEQVSKSGRLRT